ncbi:WD repeat domain phosphoinositide-interacting protein 2-like [Uloborus diversus]|uniref:WD repeat domain phosphoinositide-interacting protein 2-like n=1 Tax=Uloborus diversus TaxID=327109 RepID=UPI002409B2AF|nr:WD repeat domain phosphoinositide-interacting protein 2-like [Uloborus diversus]
MNISSDDPVTAKEILYLNFNQTSTTLTVGSKNGYMIYDLDQVYECSPTYESRNIGDICIIERNYTSSLVAYVSLHSPRSLVFYNYAKGAEIAEKLFPNTVLSVKLNREFIAVCLEDSIYIISLKNINDGSMHAITNIPTNVKGLCSMTSKDSPTLIAYPCSCTNGHVQIFDATKKKSDGARNISTLARRQKSKNCIAVFSKSEEICPLKYATLMTVVKKNLNSEITNELPFISESNEMGYASPFSNVSKKITEFHQTILFGTCNEDLKRNFDEEKYEKNVTQQGSVKDSDFFDKLLNSNYSVEANGGKGNFKAKNPDEEMNKKHDGHSFRLVDRTEM